MAGTRSNVVRGIRLAWRAAPGDFTAALALAFVGAALPPLEIWLTRHLVNLIAAGEHGEWLGPVATVLALGALFGSNHALSELRSAHQEQFGRRIQRHVMRSYLAKAAAADIAHYDDPAFHDAATRARREADWVPNQLVVSSLQLLGAILSVLGLAGLLATMHPAIGAILVGCAVLWVAVQRRFTRRLFAFHMAHTPAERERHYMIRLLSEPQAARDVRSFALADHFLGRYTALSDANDLALRKIYRSGTAMALLAALITASAVASAYALLVHRASGATPGDFVAAFGAFAALANSATMGAHLISMLERHAAFLGDYFTFLDLPTLVPVAEHPAALREPLQSGLVVSGVEFTYPKGTHAALGGLDLEVHPGELVALVGENGAGKTTIVNLLSRFYDPSNGRITLDGNDLRDLDPVTLRARIGVLMQDATKLELTVRENVQLGRIDRPAGDPELLEALESARATALLSSLSGGLDARVGPLFEGGHELSGGEWQRLAIARLMFRRADLWILDEPTSNLDPAAEAAIFAELKQQLAGRMAIVISHRFSTVRAADRIYVIGGGRVVESGNHDALMTAGGRYAELFELQAEGYR